MKRPQSYLTSLLDRRENSVRVITRARRKSSLRVALQQFSENALRHEYTRISISFLIDSSHVIFCLLYDSGINVHILFSYTYLR